MSLNPTEWIILICLLLAGIFFLYLYIAKPKNSSNKKYKVPSHRGRFPFLPNQFTLSNPKSEVITVEVFDYNGIKILHEKGVWTVNERGAIQIFKDWNELPPRYQKMVKELDNRSLQNQKQEGYFVEMINGYYYVSEPGGRKKKYKSFDEIPAKIRTYLEGKTS